MDYEVTKVINQLSNSRVLKRVCVCVCVCVCFSELTFSLVVLIQFNLILEQLLRKPDVTVFNWFNLRAENELITECP